MLREMQMAFMAFVMSAHGRLEQLLKAMRSGYLDGYNKAFQSVGLPRPHDRSLIEDTRAQSVSNSATRAVALVVGLMVGGIVAAFLLPVAVDEIVAVNTTDWGSGATSLWGILDIILVLAVFLFFIGLALSASNNI